MRISELSRTTDVPVATIKYYLREGLLHEGELTSATQAVYNDQHVARLRLIRALGGAGGLRVAAIRDVLAQLDEPQESVANLLGAAHRSLGSGKGREDIDTTDAQSLLSRLGWNTDQCDDSSVHDLAAALAALEAADFRLSDDALVNYANAMHAVAEGEIAGVPDDGADEAARYVVLGTVLIEPLILALRRLAQDDVALARLG